MANKEKELRQQPTYKRGEYEPLETGDMDAILTLAVQSVRRGQPAKYPADENGFNAFCIESRNYLETVDAINRDRNEEKKLIVDIESWCCYVGISRQTLMVYSKRGEPWASFIGFFKTTILAVKKQMAFHNKIPSVIAIFDWCNNHGYESVNRIEVQTPAEETERILTADELIAEAKKLPGFSDTDFD